MCLNFPVKEKKKRSIQLLDLNIGQLEGVETIILQLQIKWFNVGSTCIIQLTKYGTKSANIIFFA